jgi:anaerobic selenocysteine-containing dehydrogenase
MKNIRRSFLKGAAAGLGAAALPWAARGQAKASKQAMQYQDQTKNGQTCDTCLHWIPGPSPSAPGACKVVEGPINPKGWCAAYVKKG